MEDQSDDVTVNEVLLRRSPNDEDVFMFEIPDEKEIGDILYLHSFVGIFKEFTAHCIKRDVDVLRNTNYQESIIKTLKKLVFFVTVTEEKDPFYCEGLPNLERQKYIRELKVVEALCDMLYYPF